jgi:hypothetical protein
MPYWINHAGKLFGVRIGVCTTVACLLSAVVFLKPSHENFRRTTGHEKGETYQTAAKDIILLSGWDETAYEMWLTTKGTLASSLLLSEENVLEYATWPLGTVRTHAHASIPGGLWLTQSVNKSPKWEADTFKIFQTFIPGHTHYVDFGTWIGPTLLYAAQMVETSFGVEADPVAFASVTTTIVLNSDKVWGKSITVQPGAVGVGSTDSFTPTAVTMQSAKPGNSCSGIGEWSENCGDVKEKWQVNSYTLPALLRKWEVAAADAFIKVDTEAFECKLVPSWITWLESMRVKPTFYISFHDYVVKCSEQEYEAITRFAQLFKHVIISSGDTFKNIRSLMSSQSFQHGGATVIFSDR